MGAKTKQDYLKQIELNVRDTAGTFKKRVTVSLFSDTTHATVDSVEGLRKDDILTYVNDLGVEGIVVVSAISASSNGLVLATAVANMYSGMVFERNDSVSYLEQALLLYSKFRQKVNVKSEPNPNADNFAVPTDWVSGYSSVTRIEYPLSLNPISYVEDKDYMVVQQPDNTYKIKFTKIIIGALSVYYTMPHTFGAGSNPTSTVPDADFYVICDIASSYYCLALASRYAQSTDSSLGAESVNYLDKVNQFLKLSDEYFMKASVWLGVSVESLKAGSGQDIGVSGNQEIETYFDSEDSMFWRNRGGNSLLNNIY